MSSAAFCFLTLFCGLYVQMLFRITGIYLPAAAICVFYLAVAFGPRIGMVCGLTAGFILFGLSGAYAWSPLLSCPAVAAFGAWWPHHNEVQHPFRSFLPGLAVAAGVSLIAMLPTAGNESYAVSASYLTVATVFGGIMLPVIVGFCDYIAQRCGIQKYQDARLRIMKQER